MQWLDNLNNYKEVNHKDGNISNNHLENLEWITHTDNLKQRPKFTRRKFKFIDELQPSAKQFEEYKNIKYDKYYFDYDAEKLIIKTKNYLIRHKIDNNKLRVMRKHTGKNKS